VAAVIPLALRRADAKLWSVEQMLAAALESVRAGERKATKALVVYLDTAQDDGHGYDVGFQQSGMSCSEMLALLDVAAAIMRKRMGY